ncbi:DUF6443 domain-containing protein [Mucilaginibacter ginsenosidivorax]|uniref:RHS repeat-associated core domain-containing protein n=1 Tax=Mucilaginibacter ginsenosidivorax TaxID=862126 RepID=A0A5B8W6I2_9SPHI|nr:DUF6443 domain-containing protein [Mucilaginibacter ginsenosidivorax]QEC79311.1 RHS repeat-associated core domain-containing protein [Mucilaginibacter ginsenosidivorax]
MAITYITIKPELRQFCIALSFVLCALCSKAQTYLPPPATLSTTPAAGSYYSNTSITLGPTFSFTAATGSSLSLYIVAPDCVPQTTAPSLTQNYILTSAPRVGGITSTAGLAGRTTCELMQTVQYFDGLGRPLQTIQVKGSPLDKDVVQPYSYDTYGREAQKYLPYVATAATSDGRYKSTAIADQSAFYNNPSAFSAPGVVTIPAINGTSPAFGLTVFEPSPLNRPVEQGAPGADWQPVANTLTGHTVKLAYSSNNATALTDTANTTLVALYTATINTDQTRTLSRATANGGNYPANMLTITTTRDENWKSGRGGTMEEYKDKEGHVVLKRTFNYAGGTLQILSTYYVYDDLDNLAFVLPPKSGADSALPAALLNDLCYQYRYDERSRLSQKKLPGKGWEYTVYNRFDQPVLTQDANQRLTNQWMVTKYDALGRVIITGLWNAGSAIPLSTLQASIYGAAQSDVRNVADVALGYTISSYPAASSYLSVNYYDDYSFSNITDLPSAFTVAPAGSATSVRGLLTGSKINILGTSSMLWSVSYYDNLGRNIQGYKQHNLGGGTPNINNYDIITNSYDFTNVVTTSIRKHYNTTNTTSPVLTIVNTYTYDHMGRKLTSSEQINGGTNVMLSKSDYNEIGQLMAKHLHSATGVAPFLQDIDYTYNERGWLQKINDPSVAPTTTKLFSERLNYNSTQYGATPQYNGNIAEQTYNVYNSPTAGVQTVKYGYDPMNRLLSGTSSTGFTETGITYDVNGNLQTLNRTGPNAATLIYAYYSSGKSNQLQTVANGSTTFRSYGAYDANGNAPSDGAGKAFTYNLLNLPQTVTATGLSLSYTYDAAGNKLRKVSNGSATDYIDGIQYKADGTIDFVQTEEGKANRSGASYAYEYTLTDHLGNNRVTLDQTSGKVGEDDYYPFGLNVHRLQNAGNKYLYNKKELQEELNQYDYGARFYDPVIARWTSVDPHAEKYYANSQYDFVAGNPLSRIDHNGQDWFYYRSKDEKTKTWHWQEGNKATYINAKGKKVTDKKGYDYLVTYQHTGTNAFGAATGTITVYSQNKVTFTQSGVFSGSGWWTTLQNPTKGGFDAAGTGNYLLHLGKRSVMENDQKVAQGATNPAPAYGIQQIPSNTNLDYPDHSTHSVNSDYGGGRIRMNPVNDDMQYDASRDRGYYIHGKDQWWNFRTHGCVCDKTDATFNYFWGGEGSTVKTDVPMAVDIPVSISEK